MIPSSDSDSTRMAPSAQFFSDPDSQPPETSTRYKLRKIRTPNYRCGTCGLRDCVCLLQINVGCSIKTRGADLPKESCTHDMVPRLVIRAEKIYTGLERQANYPLERILFEMSKCEVAKAPCPPFKQWTYDNKGLEIILAVTKPPIPPNIAFGPLNVEREPIQMTRGISADLPHDKYGISVEPGGIYCPRQLLCLLVAAAQSSHLVTPETLRSCLENLRTIMPTDLIQCFQTIDSYRGKLEFSRLIEMFYSTSH